MSVCNTCQEDRREDQFYKGQPYSWCKVCRANRDRTGQKSVQRTREAHRNANLKRMYNIDSAVFDVFMAEQGGVCASCKEPPAEGKYLCVDHDHSCCPGTGSCGRCIRGLLCNGCNAALGHVNDSIPKLESLIRYLRSLDS